MKTLVTDVSKLIESEYGRASEKFGSTNNSDHESFAVIMEELDEAEYEISRCNSAMSMFWNLIKDKRGSSEDKLKSLEAIYRSAMLGACELIQVAVTAHKAIKTIELHEHLNDSREEE